MIPWQGAYTGVELGATTCTSCLDYGSAFTSPAGSVACTWCESKYYYVPSDIDDDSLGLSATCEPCPLGAICDEPDATIETIEIEEGFYRFSDTATLLYSCLANCLGSNDCAEGSGGPLW